jgi:hypothetical protein
MNTLWVLIVVWGSTVADGSVSQGRSDAVTMQEFSSLDRCQFASIEVHKIAPRTKMVCVQK